jgi:hypothetical protein
VSRSVFTKGCYQEQGAGRWHQYHGDGKDDAVLVLNAEVHGLPHVYVHLWMPDSSKVSASITDPDFAAIVNNCEDWLPAVDWLIENAVTYETKILAFALQLVLADRN